MNRLLLLIFLIITGPMAQAVMLSTDGRGQVLISPYYTVNNDLNTLVTITNNTIDVKAVKINIRESLGGYVVASYNVYLASYDVWVFGLIPGLSEHPDHTGEVTAFHLSPDASCTPWFPKSPTEFSTAELVDGEPGLARLREGFIEVIEMGTVTGQSMFNVFPDNNTGVCQDLQQWFTADQGQWNPDDGGDLSTDIGPATGGLSGEVNLIDVGDGISYSYPMTALDAFHAPGDSRHVSYDDASLSLDAAAPQAWITGAQAPVEIITDSGEDAVSAVLQAAQIRFSFDIATIVAAETEVALSLPTRRFYRYSGGYRAPFNPTIRTNACPFTRYSGTYFGYELYERTGHSVTLPSNSCGGCGTRPPIVYPGLCGTTGVLVAEHNFGQIGMASITGSDNFIILNDYPYSNPPFEGHISVSFRDVLPLQARLANNDRYLSYGLPVVGVVFQRYVNAGAGQGLLAQYGSSRQLITQKDIQINQLNSAEEVR
jgi:hypothetical protein